MTRRDIQRHGYLNQDELIDFRIVFNSIRIGEIQYDACTHQQDSIITEWALVWQLETAHICSNDENLAQSVNVCFIMLPRIMQVGYSAHFEA